MYRLGIAAIAGLCSMIALPYVSYAQVTHTGIVERVWEDGFRLNTGDRSVTVDSWDLYGDHTPRHISVGDRITITGEVSGRDFDAFSITVVEAFQSGQDVAAAVPGGSSGQTVLTGTVERVWEDGFRLNTGDRSVTVDSWDLYGDHTPRHVSVGDRITISGEFSGRDFDAFSIAGSEASQSRHDMTAIATFLGESSGQTVLTGTVERVWEDGFRLNTGDRSVTVDSWDLYGDHTPRHVSVGDRITISGEFSGRDFDAISVITVN